jgi:hypothetical protein
MLPMYQGALVAEDTWFVALATSRPGYKQRTSAQGMHRMDELLMKQHTVSDGQATSPTKERA